MDLEGSRPMLSLPKVIEGVKSFTLEGNNSILINAESQGISLEEYYDVIYYVQNFLRLLILDPIFPSRVSATTLRSNCPVVKSISHNWAAATHNMVLYYRTILCLRTTRSEIDSKSC